MSNTFSDLGSLTSRIKDRAQRMEDRDKPKPTKDDWFKPVPNQPVTVKFLQELTVKSKNYNEAAGTFLGAVEHQAPGKEGYRSRALDTMELEGRDWAQEQHENNPTEGWRARENFYINVAVLNEQTGEASVKILSRNIHNEFVTDLVELYEENDGTITEGVYTITRRGAGTQTTWRIKRAPDSAEFSTDSLIPWDLKAHAVRHVPYEKQREFYMRNYTPAENDQLTESAPSSISQAQNVGGQSKEEEFDW